MELDRRLFVLTAAAMPLYAGPAVVFTANEAALITALTDHIIPADDVPGALAAGVIFYIDKQLAGPLRRYHAAYQTGLAGFEASCRQQTKKAFLELDRKTQSAFLQTVESSAFFNMVVDHTMQGFYGSPEHGGNRGEASWKMLGIEAVMQGHVNQGHKH